MKQYLLMILALVISTPLHADINRVNQNLVECLKEYLRGERQIEVIGYPSESKDQLRSKVFDEIVKTCTAKYTNKIDVSLINSTDTSFTYKVGFLNDKNRLTSVVAVGNGRSVLNLVQVYHGRIGRFAGRELNIYCTDNEGRNLFGFRQLSSGRCQSICGTGEVFAILNKAKNGNILYDVSPSTNESTVLINDDVNNEMAQKIRVKGYPDGFENVCLKCGDPAVFSHSKATLSNLLWRPQSLYKKAGYSMQCIDDSGCTAGQEFVPKLNECAYKCKPYEARHFGSGQCEWNVDKACETVANRLVDLRKWYQSDSSQIVKVGSCNGTESQKIINDYFNFEENRTIEILAQQCKNKTLQAYSYETRPMTLFDYLEKVEKRSCASSTEVFKNNGRRVYTGSVPYSSGQEMDNGIRSQLSPVLDL